MNAGINFAQITSLLCEPARAQMLWSLLDGRALTATELAVCADVSPQSASGHLSRLVDAQLLCVEKQGRHRYYRFARPEVAYVIEAIASLTPHENRSRAEQKRDRSGVRYARTCYDHLAGSVAVTLTQALHQQEMLEEADSNYRLTEPGRKWFSSIGIDTEEISRSARRTFARQCLDWSERKPHLAGALGAALLNRMIALDWVRKMQGERTVVVTAKGQLELYERLAIAV